jgi:hypothetical protein
MPDFDIEAPIEDVLEQSIEADDDRPADDEDQADLPEEVPEADFAEQHVEVPEHDDDVPANVPLEAPEADYAEQHIEVPEPADDDL